MTASNEGPDPDASAGNKGGEGAPESWLEMLAKEVLDRAAVLQSEGRSFLDSELQSKLGTLCDAARNAGLTAETLLVGLKRAWITAAAPVDPTEKTALISQLVTMCIIEYYREGRSGGQPG